MKYKTNKSALLLAALVFVAANGVAVFEHICNTSNTRSFSLFSDPVCENEKPQSPCCEKKGIVKKDNCCSHKQIFSKLSIEGFTAKQLILKPLEKEIRFDFISLNLFQLKQQIFQAYYSGLSPPDNIYQIKSLLKPSSIKLQVFRC